MWQLLICSGFCLLFGNSASAKYSTHDEAGAAAVFGLYAAYSKVVADCGTPKRPAFLCSGLFLRGTVYSDLYRFWNPGPASKEASAFSWLRKDASFRQLASDHRHGYVIWSMFYAPDDDLKLQVLCAFPMDAGSHNRSDGGCGDFVATAQVERSCQGMGITTAKAWRDDYILNAKSHYRQCGFELRPDRESASANAFMQFVASHAFPEVVSEHFATVGLSNNEVRIASWPQSDGSRVPIWVIFWISKDTVTGAPSEVGKSEAQKDQIALYEYSGKYVPVVRITLPSSPSEEATFFYAPEDQAQLVNVQCRRFIDKAQWVNRYDPGVRVNRWTLEITPTDCGRLSQADQLDKFYAEVVAKYGNDEQWVADYQGGVRRQLACVLATYRTKDTYNLEPFRRDASQAEAVAAGCNVI